MRRSTPFADIVRHLTPFFVSPPGDLRRRPGRHRPGRARGRLPDQPARRLLRGRGRARDHAEAADHQHPRRAARGPGESTGGCTSSSATPTWPRSRRTSRSAPTALVLAMIEERFITADLAVEGPVAALRAVSHDPTLKHLVTLIDGRPDDRRAAPDGVPRPGPQVRRGPVRRRRRRPDRRRAGPLGVGARPARARPDAVRGGARLGGQAQAARASTATATAWPGTTPSCT